MVRVRRNGLILVDNTPGGRERVTGIEPAFSAWEADVLPLNYTRGGRREFHRETHREMYVVADAG